MIALAAAALIAVALGSRSLGVVYAQEGPDCQVTDIGSLSYEGGGSLETEGKWTTEDCDSAFRTGSDAHTYKFEVIDAGRIRISLSSAEGDSFLYLLAEDGRRIVDNDDGGAGIDARVERDLAPGTYMVEATTVGGRERGEAEFTLTISYVEGCETIDLGALGPEPELVATGSWSLETCGSTYVVEHPAYRYSFSLAQDGRVVIDLESEHGDPVLSLAETTRGIIAANDAGGERRNSRIKGYLHTGNYVVEATTYLERDLQPLQADFTLTIKLLDEEAEQKKALIKVEETHGPDIAIANVPFAMHYRIGNLGLGDLSETGDRAWVYLAAPSWYYLYGPTIKAEDGHWGPGASYHTGDVTAIPSSTRLTDVKPFQVTIRKPGPSWIWVGIVTYNEDDEEIGFQGNWRNLMVLSGYAFDPMKVLVEGLEYGVSAEADEEGEVTHSVTSSIIPNAVVPSDTQARALYAAGVHTQMLEGLFDRPAVAILPTTGDLEATSVANPSSRNLMKLYGNHYATALRDAGMKRPLLDGQSVNPVEVEDLLLDMAGSASARAVSLVGTWKSLQARVGDSSPISFVDAFALHSQLAYAEKVLAPIIAASEIVEAARAAEEGWEDASVQFMVEDYENAYSCGRPASIATPLRRADVPDLTWMLTADTEMRAALPFYGTAVDGILCGNGADAENEQFFASLSIPESESFLAMFDITPPPTSDPAPYKLRILSRLTDDGQIEHGVELSNGEQILPERRHLPADATVDEWVKSSDVIVGEEEEEEGEAIGQIRSRRLEDGRVEVGYITIADKTVTPRIRYLPSEMPVGVWFRSSNVNAPRPDDS